MTTTERKSDTDGICGVDPGLTTLGWGPMQVGVCTPHWYLPAHPVQAPSSGRLEMKGGPVPFALVAPLCTAGMETAGSREDRDIAGSSSPMPAPKPTNRDPKA